jgi:hypothetical protein
MKMFLLSTLAGTAFALGLSTIAVAQMTPPAPIATLAPLATPAPMATNPSVPSQPQPIPTGPLAQPTP